MTGESAAAAALLRAAAKARALRGGALVVKLGGSAMEDPAATRGTLEAVAALQTLGLRLVLVHGGGKPIDRAMAEAGLSPRKVAGRRYTDDATLDVVVHVLGALNRELVAGLAAAGGAGAGFCDPDARPADFPVRGGFLTLPGVDDQPIDLGRVGKPTAVYTAALTAVQDRGYVPILPSLAVSEDDFGWLNVNADTAAAAVAGAFEADACYFLTDTPGVLRDVREPGSVIPRLTASDCRQLIADGVIDGGMVPKVEACFAALEAGAARAVILDGRDPHALLGEFVADRVAGTEIVN
jgi:acetylglutamate kinase